MYTNIYMCILTHTYIPKHYIYIYIYTCIYIRRRAEKITVISNKNRRVIRGDIYQLQSRTYRPKRCHYNNKDVVNTPDILSHDYDQA